ncbi:MAG: sugar transferase [Thermosynechococcaceae cyanobacterium]
MHNPRNKTSALRKIQEWIKISLDRLFALLLLVLLLPLFAGIAVAVYVGMGHPIVFAQPRPGKDEKIFTFYKFRTMTDQRDSQGALLPDAQRLTPFGEFLRQTSLDELPQLWNIVTGNMSFVGPRPLIVQYLERYSPEQARRHGVHPGITGLAQVKGRNAISWEEKFKLDVWYIDHWSLWLDFKIMVLTLWKVVSREGINQEGFATSEEFKGQS